MATANDTYLIECGTVEPLADDASKYRKAIQLDTHPIEGNINLKYQNIGMRLAQDIPSIGWDMLEVATYVYCADQAVSRGGKIMRGHGRDWYRNFELRIPVRNPEAWQSQAVSKALLDTLNFLTDDAWVFHFTKADRSIPTDPYIDFAEDEPWFPADEVMLFSGGLDSLGGAVEGLISQGKRLLLVSHRPVASISSRQVRLVRALERMKQSRGKLIHVPVWVNRKGGPRADPSQRARSFLYIMLGAVVALMHKVKRVNFYENGIVTMNLSGLEQIVGARATRSTHPQVLHGFTRLISEVTGQNIQVDNPFIWKTKSDVVKLICDLGQSKLIVDTKTCTHTRGEAKPQTHCGVCSQCVERRIATLHNDVGEDDPEELYKTRLFTDPLPNKEAKVMAESHLRHNREVEQMDETEFWTQNEKLSSMLGFLPGNTSEKARKVYELHHRNAKQVAEVVKTQIERHSDNIRQGTVEPGSLLAMITAKSTKKTPLTPHFWPFPTPQGAGWKDITIAITSRDSLHITCLEVSKSYLAWELGFQDRRKGDRYTKQWDLLIDLADGNGVLSWASPKAKAMQQKFVQALRHTLSEVFGLSDSPIHNYRKRTGYVAKFHIRNVSGSAPKDSEISESGR